MLNYGLVGGGNDYAPLVKGAQLTGFNLAAGTTNSGNFTFNTPSGGSGSYSYSAIVSHIEGSGATLSGSGLGPYSVSNLEDEDVVVVILTITDSVTGQTVDDFHGVAIGDTNVVDLIAGTSLSGQSLAAGTTSSNSFTFNAPTGDTYVTSVAVSHLVGSGATVSGSGLGAYTVNSLEDGDIVLVTATHTGTDGDIVKESFIIYVAATSVTFNTYSTWSALNSASSPSDGDYGLVQQGESAQTMKYIGTFDSVAVNAWLPAGFAERMTGLVTDSSSNKCYFDVPAGDDLSAVTARGWSDSGGTTDVSGYLQIDSTASVESLLFTSNLAAGKELLIYFEATPVAVAGGSGHNGVQIQAKDGSNDIRCTLSENTTVGQYQLLTSGGGREGDEEAVVADDTPTVLWLSDQVGAKLIPYGITSGEYMSMSNTDAFATTTSKEIGPITRSGSGNTIKVARFFAFYVN